MTKPEGYQYSEEGIAQKIKEEISEAAKKVSSIQQLPDEVTHLFRRCLPNINHQQISLDKVVKSLTAGVRTKFPLLTEGYVLKILREAKLIQ